MLTTKEAADKLNCAYTTVFGWIKKGYLHPVVIEEQDVGISETEIERLKELHPDGYISTSEAARLLGCSSGSINRKVRSGELPYKEDIAANNFLHVRYLYKLSDVLKLKPVRDKRNSILLDEAEVAGLHELLRNESRLSRAPDHYMDTYAVAEYLGCSYSLVGRLAREGKLPYVYLKGRQGAQTRYYLVSDVDGIRPLVEELVGNVPSDLLNLKEVMSILSISRSCAVQLIEDGKLKPAYKHKHARGYSCFFNLEDVLALDPKHVVDMDCEWIGRVADICSIDDISVAQWILDGFISSHKENEKLVITEQDAVTFLDDACKNGDWRKDRYFSYKDLSYKLSIDAHDIWKSFNKKHVKPSMFLVDKYVRFLESDVLKVFPEFGG